SLVLLCFSWHCFHRALHSFPTRRSSDLTSDGAGVKLRRSLGSVRGLYLDPFLMLDEFSSDDAADYIAGFPSHPHRGFETVTYMRSEEHTSELQSRGHLVCRLLLEKKKQI